MYSESASHLPYSSRILNKNDKNMFKFWHTVTDPDYLPFFKFNM